MLVVERALSGDIEGTTKGRRNRYVPLGDQALGALDRLSRRANFMSTDDYRMRASLVEDGHGGEEGQRALPHG